MDLASTIFNCAIHLHGGEMFSKRILCFYITLVVITAWVVIQGKNWKTLGTLD